MMDHQKPRPKAGIRSCNLHSDCDAADEMIRAAGGRMVRSFHEGPYIVYYAQHCNVEDCEDCFGC